MAKTKKEVSNRKMLKGILLVVGLLLGCVVAFFVFAIMYQGDTRPILSVADQFKPDDSWQLTEEKVEPPRIICAGDVSCPSVLKRWIRDEPLTLDELRLLMNTTGWEYSIKGICDPLLSDRYTCSVSAKDSSAGMSIYIWLDTDSELHGQISIDIRRI